MGSGLAAILDTAIGLSEATSLEKTNDRDGQPPGHKVSPRFQKWALYECWDRFGTAKLRAQLLVQLVIFSDRKKKKSL